MRPAWQLPEAAFQIIVWAASIALVPMLAGRNLGQSEPVKPPAVNKETSLVRLTMTGWTEEAPGDGQRYWHDSDGDILTLKVLPKILAYPLASRETEQRKWCRKQAKSRNAGLIEVHANPSEISPSASFIYKRLQKPAYIYTGQYFTWIHGANAIWVVVARERGTTGLREAIVTSNLMSSGKLTLDGYKKSWAQDPYEPGYLGVDRSVLRFMSDDESYDAQFPKHPLSKVRRVLAALPDGAQYDFEKP